MPERTRVLVVGLDAADRNVAIDLAGRGRLPHIAALLGSGTRADVDTPYGTLVGAVWPNFATGLRPSRHGRYCYEQLEPGTYETRRTVPPSGFFWTAAARAGRRVATVDIPHTDVEAGVEGVQVVGWAQHDNDVGFRTLPEEFGRSLIERYGAQLDDACNAFGRLGAIAELRDHLVDGIGRKAAFAADLVASEPWDLFMVVFGESHCIGHQGWAMHDPTHPQHDASAAAAAGDPLEDVYGALDAAVGQIVEAAGDDMTVVLLLSHGMAANYQANRLLPTMLERIEDADAPPPRAVALRRRGEREVRRVKRKLASRRGKRAAGYVRMVDGSRRYFAVPNNNSYGGIRLNVIDREPHGRIAAGEQFEETCQRLESQLHRWVNRETGEPLVSRVVRATDHDPGPWVCALPDLFVEWNRSHPIRSVEAPGLGRIDRKGSTLRTGDHRPGGLVVTRGGGIPAGAVHPVVKTEDLAPTICAAIGVELPDVDGILQPGLLAGAEAFRG